ncbi:MAG: 6-bladed beta-propeller [Candidatus Aminicenantes bacterium]|nr:6-bladed beta-propeller [Candidatus Aminicenantes bacterium]
MKRLFFLTLVISFIIGFTACSQQKSEWAGKIEVIDGVTVVHNPKEPMYDEGVFQIEENLSIGTREGNENYMFSNVTGVGVDENNNIYILDNREVQIKKYDKNGIYIRTIGRKGQGPGEMMSCYSFLISPQNEIVVSDVASRRLTFFTLDGDYVRMLSMAQSLLIFPGMDSRGYFYSTMTLQDEKGSMTEYQKYSPELEYLLSIISAPPRLDSRTYEYHPFRPMLISTLSENDLIICGYPILYEVELYNTQGKLIKKILKDYDPVSIGEDVLKDVKKRRIPEGYSLELSQHYPPYSTIFADDENRLFVGTYEKLDNRTIYDVFDEEGRFIVKVSFKSFPLLLKKGHLYSREVDEEGYPVLKRYIVTWDY